MVLRGIDVTELVDQGIPDQPVVPEREALLEVQLLLGQGIRRIPIEHRFADVGLLRRQRYVKAVGA